ncbi:hypothetical protein [Dyella acidisoli]|uniref:DUF1573 domain-containing protein n=1 Tax=Dyella acidisoli TaxID=1867834 RepID=A0ABQ5XIZ1_9GAMM|nr:hypothetical protein [Dyella acidisoli]GLQ91676.1 hypothetical protein GCM10007901_06260 [Dyella acidisoli]
MTTITLMNNIRQEPSKIHAMTALPMGVRLKGLSGGPTQFKCSNPLDDLKGAKSVQITYDATVRGDPHESVQVSSVMP